MSQSDSKVSQRLGRSALRCALSSLFVSCTAGAILLAKPTGAHAQASFTPLGLFGQTHSVARDVSADGSVVVGTSVIGGTGTISVFRWTREGVMVRPSSIEDAAVSADGSTVVGTYPGPNGTEAFRWMEDGTFEGIGDLPGGLFSSAAFDVSDDGRVIVGVSSTSFGGQTVGQAYRWTQETGMVAIDRLGTRALATSGDGSVIVGTSADLGGFRWPEGLTKPLGLPGAFEAVPHAISADGSTIVGETVFREGLGGFRSDAMRWTADDGSVALPPANSMALDVSSDGSVVVGTSFAFGAFYWTEQTGMIRLQDLLVSLGVTNLDGWTLTRAEGISPDGRTIVGAGGHNGHLEAFVATVPEPSTIIMTLFGAITGSGLYVSRRRRS